MAPAANSDSIDEETARGEGVEVEACDIHQGLLGVERASASVADRMPRRFALPTMNRHVLKLPTCRTTPGW